MGRKMSRSELATTMPDSAFKSAEVRRVVAAIDCTPAGLDALREASNALRGFSNGELHVVHVAGPDRGPVTASVIEKNEKEVEDEREKLRRYVLSHAHDLPSFGRVETVLHLRYGDPEKMVRDLCADVDADLLVVGTDDPKGMARLFHTSLSASLAKSAHCPVLIARPKLYDSVDTNGHERTSVEPPCPDCMTARSTSGDAGAWCERHAQSGARATHLYGYDESLGFGMHDNETMGPTGV